MNSMASYQNYPYYGAQQSQQPSYYPPTPHMGVNPNTGYPPIPGPSNGYPPFYAPPTFGAPQIPPGPVPMSFDAAAYTTQPGIGADALRSNRHRRAATTSGVKNNSGAPLKPALKKRTTIPPLVNESQQHQMHQAIPQTRTRTNSQNRQAADLVRSRTYSNPKQPIDFPSVDPNFTSYHMFVSFRGYNELRLENITELALKELRETIWPLWSDGIESDVVKNHTCIVRFRNSPWDMNGPDSLLALKIILELFQLCAQRGYTFQAAVNTASPSPRLIFQVTSPDPESQFFLAYFSQGGRRLTMINPPPNIDIYIGARLKAALPRKIDGDYVVNDNIRVVEVKKGTGFGAAAVEPSHFLMHVLRIIESESFELNATVALARRGPLGIRYKREILVFKKIPIDR